MQLKSSVMDLENIETVLVDIEHCGQLELIRGDFTSEKMKKSKNFSAEFSLYKTIFEQIKPNVCFDVGANIGAYSAFFSKHCGQVYSFEPNPYVFDVLKRNAVRGDGNIHTFSYGLSDEAAELPLSIPLGWHTGSSSFAHDSASSSDGMYRTVLSRVESGDFVMKAEQIETLDFIKIDTEGFEANVLVGLERTIAKNKPVIALEWNSDVTRRGFIQHRIFEEMLSEYMCLGLGEYWDKILYSSVFSKIKRGVLKNIFHISHQDILQKFYFQHDYQMIFLFPQKYAGMVEQFSILPQGYRPKMLFAEAARIVPGSAQSLCPRPGPARA